MKLILDEVVFAPNADVFAVITTKGTITVFSMHLTFSELTEGYKIRSAEGDTSGGEQ